MAMRHRQTRTEPAPPVARRPVRPVEHHHEREAIARDEAVIREPFGVAQAMAFFVGLASLVIGAIGLIRTGTEDVTVTTAEVIGMEMTGVLALSHIGLGLLALLGAGMRGAASASMLFIGPLLIAAGIVALAQDVPWLGWNQINGIVYLVAGAVALAAAAFTPERTVVEHRTISIED